MIISHSRGSYPINFTTFEALDLSGVVIVDSNVLAAWPSLSERDPIVVPAGEASKSLSQYERVLHELAERGARRGTRLTAVGGGVVGDLVGFVASTYLRGVDFIQVPTTLLAMVDSSVGGKVGLDLPQGKNLVGAFWPPVEVKIAPDFLTTLPARQVKNGMAEVLKTAFIRDPALLSMTADLAKTIQRCVEIKAEVVQADEFDRTGLRAILNFGHTLGHAIEAVHRYETYLHGEAIAIGMVAEARLGERLGITSAGTADLIEHYLKEAGLPTAYDGWRNRALLEAIRLDKKNDAAGLGFSLLIELGRCKLVTGIAESDVAAFLEAL